MEVVFNHKEVKTPGDIPRNGVVVLKNHPVFQSSYAMSTIVHLHIKDGEVRSYDIINTGKTNSTWVEDFTGFDAILLWIWLNSPLPMNFYGNLETRSLANLYTEEVTNVKS